MKLHISGGRFFVNSLPISKRTLDLVFGEILKDQWSELSDDLQRNGEIEVYANFSKVERLAVLDKLKKERRKNELLTAQLRATEEKFCAI